jgi:2-polyprenyl-6-methoxyphenol hydroxylase-like FAD-dependent oxidoreductase
MSTNTSNTVHVDVLVVGARAAGASTAMLLARRGARVMMVDRSAYGSDTLSSHALMRGAVDRLHRWGLLARVWDAGTPVIRRAVFGYGTDELALDVSAADGVPGLAAPRRTVLDPILVDAAVDAGAAVRHGTALVRVLRDATGRVCGARLRDEAGTFTVSCDLLVGADGLHSGVARQVGAPVTRTGAHASAYVLRYVRDLDAPDDAYQWRYGVRSGAGVVPTNDATWCVFAAMPPDRFATGRADLDHLMRTVLREVDGDLARRIERSTPAGPLRSWPGTIGRFRRPQGHGWTLVGDAGYFKDPFAAHGISDALRDAELLCDAVTTGDLTAYEARRDALSAPLFEALERVASYELELGELPDLHVTMARAMRDEELALAGR